MLIINNSFTGSKMNQDQEDEVQIEEQEIVALQINDMDWIIKPQLQLGMQIGGLAISNMVFCQDREKMEKEKFKAVLSICGDKLELPVTVQHLWIVIEDHPKQNISMFFNSTFIFIEKHIKQGNVLIHCRAGISRSCSIAIAYLIRKNQLSFSQAFQIVKSNRPIAFPNKGFTKQLKRFANQIKPSPQANKNALKRSKSGIHQNEKVPKNCLGTQKSCIIF